MQKLKEKIIKCEKKIILIIGNDNFLIQENLRKILKLLKKNNFKKSEYYNIKKKTNWNEIYKTIQSLDLFTNKNIILKIEEKENTEKTSKKLINLFNISHPKTSIILKIEKLNKKYLWYKKIKNTGIFIQCSNLEGKNLLEWINKKTKKMGISLNEQIKEILCYYYERNIFALNQIFKNILILYNNQNITINNIKKIIHYSSNFKNYHWIESIFLGNIEKSIYILKKLKQENYESILLLYSIQKELFLILKIKKKKQKEKIEKIFENYQIWKLRRNGIKKIIKRISIKEVIIIIRLISKIELKLKQGNKNNIWKKLEIISILLCKKNKNEILIKILEN